MRFFTNSLAMKLIALSSDKVSEVREAALHILFHYFPLDRLSEFKGIIRCTYNKLLNNSKAQNSECGALLVQFYFQWFLLKDQSIITGSDEAAQPIFAYLNAMLFKVKTYHAKSCQDCLNSFYNFPIHGWLLAISVCFKQLCSSLSGEKARQLFATDSFCNFVCDITTNVTDIVHFLLGAVFSCISTSKHATQVDYIASADFQQISLNICQIIFQSTSKYHKDTMITSCQEILLSQDFEIVMSSCWLTLKNSCICLSEIACFVLHSKVVTHMNNAKKWFDKLSNIFVTVLSMCRHQGVLESCYNSFIKLLTGLYNSKSFFDIPAQLIAWQLQPLDCNLAVKVTDGGTVARRSGGIPLIVDALLAANFSSDCYQNEALVKCLEALIRAIATLNKIELSKIYIAENLPQVKALYMAKNICQNKKIGSHVLPYLSKLFIATVSCLDSSIWIVRNAAIQLLGSLFFRMFSQKNIENTKSLSASELFFRFPELLHFYEELFAKDVSSRDGVLYSLPFANRDFLTSAIYPVISFLSKIVYVHNPICEKNEYDIKFIFVFSKKLLSNRYYFIRSVAVEILLALCSPAQILSTVEVFLQILSDFEEFSGN